MIKASLGNISLILGMSVAVAFGIIIAQNAAVLPGPADSESPNPPRVLEPPAPSDRAGIDLRISPSVPQYSLPLNAGDIDNWDSITGMSEDSKIILLNNGFAVDNYYGPSRIVRAYQSLYNLVPIFVTTDSMLHLYHVQFSETLKTIEENHFYDDLNDLSKLMYTRSIEQHESLVDPVLKEAAASNAAFFAVGAKILDEDFSPNLPGTAMERAVQEYSLINDASGAGPSPLFGYKIDYSLFTPRGHYAQNEILERYFKAMTWYGIAAFIVKPDTTQPEEKKDMQTIQAVMLSDLLLESRSAKDTLDRINKVTTFYAGHSDDLGPYEYASAYQAGGFSGYADLLGSYNMGLLKAELAKSPPPKILGGSRLCQVAQWTPDAIEKCLGDSAGMRLMGQRFTPDSYVFSSLTSQNYTGSGSPFTVSYVPSGPVRGFPTGLDVMAALGSDRALQIMEGAGDTEYDGYHERLLELREEISKTSSFGPPKTLYLGWMYALAELLKSAPEGYPTFMQTPQWEDKDLNTALSSWSQLRHDTILYAKQSYNSVYLSAEPEIPKTAGYVEPALGFYLQLYALTEMTGDGLMELGLLDEDSASRMESLKGILDRLIDISKKELENKALTQDDYDFIAGFGDRLSKVTEGKDGDKRTTLIADVHTDPNTSQVLEVGTGNLDMIFVAYRLPDDRILVGAGPVLSYYEFKHPISDRLTDQRWFDLLHEDPPERPAWIGSFRGDYPE